MNKRIATIMMVLIFTLTSALSFAQNKVTVTGVVTDDTKLPVMGAGVLVHGLGNVGTTTDLDGNYSITVDEDAVLDFSYLGMASQSIPVNGRTVINVELAPDNTFLDNSIVVGYGTQKKGSITGSVVAISADDLIKTKTDNPMNMLTGRLPGVRVWQTSAEPGTYSGNIDVRGLGAPLFIIDGVPRDQSYFQRLAPGDIDNVSVLKDASASIYGVRGANGVILVTTKKGQSGKSSVSYSGSFTLQQPSKMPKLMNAYDAMTVYNEREMNKVDGGSPFFTEKDFQDFRDGTRKETDWNKLVFAPLAPQNQHDLSISGGSDKVQYYVSMGYFNQQSFFKSGDLNYEKFNVRGDITAEIVKGLKFNLNISALKDYRHTPYTDAVNIIRNYWRQGVLFPAYADEAETMLNYDGLELEENTVAMMTSDVSGYRKYVQKNVSVAASLSYDFGTVWEPLKGLTAKILGTYDYRQNDNEIFRKEYYLYAKNKLTGGYDQKLFAESTPNNLRKENFQKTDLLGQVVLDYKRTFGEKHEVGATVGWESTKKRGDNIYAYGNLVFGSPYFTALEKEGQVIGLDAGSGSFYDLGYMSAFGRLNYTYDNRYIIEGQFRYDASSKFPAKHHWAFFPSVSAGWRISQEPFIKNNPSLRFINQLKLRGSYGTMGDDGSMNYEWVQGYKYPAGGTSDRGFYNGWAPGEILNGGFVYGVIEQPMATQNVTWFVSHTYDIGLDWEFWHGKFGGAFDWFHRKRTGLFANNFSDVPTVVGAKPQYENLNSDSHYGFELSLTHRNQVGDFSYGLTGVVTITRQKYLTYVQRSPETFANSYDRWRFDNMNNRYQGVQFGYEGAGRYKDWNDIWSYDIYKDRDLLPGDYKYQDWNGDGEINGLDEHPYAFDQTPWMNYSLNADFAYKNWDLTILFQGSALGSMAYKEPLYSIWGSNGGGTLKQYTDRWHPVDPSADPYNPETEWVKGYYGYTGHYPKENSSFNRVSTAYLRLKSVELGYTLPEIHKLRDLKFRVYVNAYNPLTFTKVKFVDPEHPDSDLGRMYPLNKTYTIGLNITF